MSPEISERSFEEAIECRLLQHGPDAPRATRQSSAGLCRLAVTCRPAAAASAGRRTTTVRSASCRATWWTSSPPHSPGEWQKLAQHHGAAVKEQFLRRLATEVERRVTLD